MTLAKHSGNRRRPARCGRWRKRRYRTEYEAQHVIELREAAGSAPLYWFPCSRCEGFHLTHEAPRER